MPTGIGAVESDGYQIDIDRFTRFVDELARRYLGSRHPILRSMIEGFTATALVLVDRAGGNVPSLSEPPAPDGRDASAGTGGLAAGGDAARLAELREEHAAAMPY